MTVDRQVSMETTDYSVIIDGWYCNGTLYSLVYLGISSSFVLPWEGYLKKHVFLDVRCTTMNLKYEIGCLAIRHFLSPCLRLILKRTHLSPNICSGCTCNFEHFGTYHIKTSDNRGNVCFEEMQDQASAL